MFLFSVFLVRRCLANIHPWYLSGTLYPRILNTRFTNLIPHQTLHYIFYVESPSYSIDILFHFKYIHEQTFNMIWGTLMCKEEPVFQGQSLFLYTLSVYDFLYLLVLCCGYADDTILLYQYQHVSMFYPFI